MLGHSDSSPTVLHSSGNLSVPKAEESLAEGALTCAKGSPHQLLSCKPNSVGSTRPALKVTEDPQQQALLWPNDLVGEERGALAAISVPCPSPSWRKTATCAACACRRENTAPFGVLLEMSALTFSMILSIWRFCVSISLPMSRAMWRKLPMMPLTCSRFSSISFSRASFVTLGGKKQIFEAETEEALPETLIHPKPPLHPPSLVTWGACCCA